MKGIDQKKKQLANEQKKRVGRRRALSLMAALVIVATAVALMMPAISMTRGELVCGLEEHQHSDACYEQVLVCGYGEASDADDAGDEADGEDAVADSGDEAQAHVHSDACYEQRLVCEMREVEAPGGCPGNAPKSGSRIAV